MTQMAARMRRYTHTGVVQAHADAARMQRDMQEMVSQTRAAAAQMQPIPAPTAWTSMSTSGGSQGVSTSVVNGEVFVNGEWVATAPRGATSLEVRNGVVRMNGEAIWPRADHAQAQAHSGGLRRIEGVPEDQSGEQEAIDWRLAGEQVPSAPSPVEVALRSSRTGVCDCDREEPCAVCLERITAGHHTRTLPCFHVLHRSCAEAHFRWHTTPVHCPICRTAVSTEGV